MPSTASSISVSRYWRQEATISWWSKPPNAGSWVMSSAALRHRWIWWIDGSQLRWIRGMDEQPSAAPLLRPPDLVGYLTWPGHAQVFQLTRVWKEHGQRHEQVRYGVTSLPPEIGTAERLLALKRGHWCIENRAHRTK